MGPLPEGLFASPSEPPTYPSLRAGAVLYLWVSGLAGYLNRYGVSSALLERLKLLVVVYTSCEQVTVEL